MSSLTKRLALHGLLDPPRERRPHPGDLRGLVQGGLTDAADAPEAAQQGALARRTDAVDVVEHAADGPLRTNVLVIGHGEAMRLVADALDEVEALRRARQQDRIRPRRHEQLLALLCERGDRYTQQSRVGERGLPGGELALAAVEDHEVRDRPAVAVVDRPLEPPAQRVAQVGEVVVAGADLRAEPAVRVLRRAPALESDHRG